MTCVERLAEQPHEYPLLSIHQLAELAEHVTVRLAELADDAQRQPSTRETLLKEQGELRTRLGLVRHWIEVGRQAASA